MALDNKPLIMVEIKLATSREESRCRVSLLRRRWHEASDNLKKGGFIHSRQKTLGSVLIIFTTHGN